MHTYFRRILGGLAAGVILATLPLLAGAAQAQTKKQPKAQTAATQTASDEKPNILFIMGDDIGWMQPKMAMSAFIGHPRTDGPARTASAKIALS